MADIRDPFAKPNPSAGRDLVSRPNFTIPGADTPQMSAARPAPDSVMPSRPTGRDLVTRPNFTMGGKAPLPMVDEVVRAPTQPVSPTVRDPRFATKPLSPEAQQFRSTMFQGPKTPPGWVPPNPGAATAGAAPKPAPMPSTGGLARLGNAASVTLAGGQILNTANQIANFTSTKEDEVIRGAIDRENNQKRLLAEQYGPGTLDAAYKAESPWYHFGGVKNSRPEDLEKWTQSYLRGGVEGGRGRMVPQYPEGWYPGKGGSSQPEITAGRGSAEYARNDPRLLAQVNEAPTGKIEDRTLQPIDPGRESLGASRDFTKELGKVPVDLPTGLREGVVFKTKDANGRTVYSGMNVKQDAVMVDGRGANIGQLNDGPNFSLRSAVPQGQGQAAQPSAGGTAQNSGIGFGGMSTANGLALSEARQAAAARGDWDAVAGSYGREGFRGAQPQQVAQTPQSGLRMAPADNKQVMGMIEQMSRSPRARDRNAAAQLLADMNKAQDRNAVDLQGQQASAASARYASDNSLRGTVYSADSSANTQLAAKQMEIQRQMATRQAMAAAYQATGGKLDETRKLMLANGFDPEIVEKSIAADNAATAANQNVQAKAVDRLREDVRVFRDDGDGRMVEDPQATQAKLDAIRQVFKGATTMGTDAYEQQSPMIKALGGIYDKARSDTNFGLGSYMPWADEPKRLSAMPNWQGGKLSKTSGLKGAFTTGGLEKGHYIVEHGGREYNLGHLDDLQRSLIEEHLKTGKWE